MTKKDVVSQICEKTGMETKDVALTIDTMFRVIEENLAKGKAIYLRGFASLIIKKKRAKKGRKNFQAGGIGEQINIPAKNAPKFIPSKRIVRRVEKIPV